MRYAGADLAYTFYEFFAGGAWRGLGWPSVDMSVCERHRPQKGVDLQSELGRQELIVRDVAKIKTRDLLGSRHGMGIFSMPRPVARRRWRWS